MEARPTLTVTDARTGLPAVLKTFREKGIAAPPVVVGSHRKPEAVLLSHALFERVCDDEVTVVLAVGSGRDALSGILETFRTQGLDAAPVAVGKRGDRDGVLMSFERYAQIADDVDDVLAGPALRERLARTDAAGGPAVITLGELAAQAGIDFPPQRGGGG